MARPKRIDWSDPQVKGIYEDMVSVLLSRLNPTAQRIDGSGGDGGRDVQIPLPGRLEFYELKSFSDRVSKAHGRRKQVERSLARAATHNPNAWYLVVPVNHTEGELEWFEDMAALYNFPCTWLGKDWLNGQMALFPELPRYYIEHASDEVVDMLREVNAEAASFNNGIVDAIDRVRFLTARFNTVSPHYAWGFSCTPEGLVTVSAAPRYRGAELDNPIQISPSFNFPDTEAGRAALAEFQDTVDYGTRSVIPAEFVESLTVSGPREISGTFPGGELTLNAVLVDGADPEVSFRVLSADSLVIAHLPMDSGPISRGNRGGEIPLFDKSGTFTARLRLNLVSNEVNATFNLSRTEADRSFPAALIPALAFLEALKPGNYWQALSQGVPIGPPVAVPDVFYEHANAVLNVNKTLAELQLLSNTYFLSPFGMTYDEFEEAVQMLLVFRGEILTGTWNRARFGFPNDFIESPDGAWLTRDEVLDFWHAKEATVAFGGRDYPLGRLVRIEYSSARIEREPAVVNPESGMEITPVVFMPIGEGTARMFLVGEDETE